MTDLERIEASALSQQITLEQYVRQVLRDPGGYSKRTVTAVREWEGGELCPLCAQVGSRGSVLEEGICSNHGDVRPYLQVESSGT